MALETYDKYLALKTKTKTRQNNDKNKKETRKGTYRHT